VKSGLNEEGCGAGKLLPQPFFAAKKQTSSYKTTDSFFPRFRRWPQIKPKAVEKLMPSVEYFSSFSKVSGSYANRWKYLY